MTPKGFFFVWSLANCFLFTFCTIRFPDICLLPVCYRTSVVIVISSHRKSDLCINQKWSIFMTLPWCSKGRGHACCTWSLIVSLFWHVRYSVYIWNLTNTWFALLIRFITEQAFLGVCLTGCNKIFTRSLLFILFCHTLSKHVHTVCKNDWHNAFRQQ